MSEADEVQDMIDDAVDRRHRRKDDYAQVEIARMSNGAKRNALIQTATLVSILLTMLGTFVTLVWFAAGLKGGVEQNTELAMRAITGTEEMRARVRAVEDNQAQITASMERSNVILDRIVLRLDDTRDRVIRVEEGQR